MLTRLLENKHFVIYMEDIMEILPIARRGIIISIFVKLHIDNKTSLDNRKI
jgi:hypothetical protein